MKRRLLNLAIAFDQLLYVILTLGYGSPLETCSAAAYRVWLNRGIFSFFKPIIDLVFWVLEKDHCRLAYENLRMLKHLPNDYKTQ